MSEGERLANGDCGKPELVIEFVDNADMNAPPQTLNKETLTPWGATNVCPDTQTKGVNTDCTNDNSDPAMLRQNGDLTTHTENLTTIGSSEWNVPGGSSDWPVMSHDGYHDDLSSNERREFDSLWGETSSTQKLASENETDGSFVHPSNRARHYVMPRDEGALDPFGQGNDMFGSGFTDNFCEMSETDLIFRSGLVDEEFKTICVTAEEDDLWSSFTDVNDSSTAGHQSTDPGSWDPFPANREPPKTEPEQEMKKEHNLDSSPSKMENQISEDQHELTRDFTKEQLPCDQQPCTDQHSSIDKHSTTTTVFKMEETRPSLSANGNVHYENPSNSVTASFQSSMINLNMSQMLEDSAFRETILDESWRAEDDCLESKDVTVDLTVQSVGIETEDQTTATEFSSQAILNSQLSKMDHFTSASNNQLALNQELSKLPGDINANVSTNGQQQNILIDFGDSGTSDTKFVVTPPPEFNNGFESLMDGTEMNHTPVAVNSELSNDLLITTNGTSVADVKEIRGKETKTERTPSDLERFLNQLGDGTVVDDQATNERTLIDMDSFLDQLGDGTMIDEKRGNGSEHNENERRSPEEDKGSTRTDLNHAKDKRQTPSDVDRLLNELGDGTAIDDEETENGHASGGVDGVMIKSAVVNEEVLIKKRTPSDVDRFLNELGDGTVIDEDGDSLMSQEENHLDPLGRSAEDKAKEEDVKLDRTPSRDEQSIQETNRAWEQMVKEGSITMTENLFEKSSNVNQLSFHEMDRNIDITAKNVAKVETRKSDPDVKMNEKKAVQSSVEGPKSSQAIIKQDLNAKRRSFFGEDSDSKNTTFQPVVPDKPGSSSGSSIRHSWALPTVPVLPKLQCSYQRPESFYETKPRAATDSLLSSHALLGLGGNQTVSTDTKSRSASEPSPNSAKTVWLTDKPTGSEKDTSSKPKDSSIEAKSTQFIQALYSHKPGISSEIVEDEKTPLEYERERKNVLAAMKVKRKKRVSWQGSHSNEMTSPDSEDPLSPSPISNSNEFELSRQNWKSQNLGRQEGSGDAVTKDLTSKLEPRKPVTYASKLPPSVTREQMVTNRLDKQGPNLLDQKDTEVLETKTMAYDSKSTLKSPAETLESATSNKNPRKKAPFVQSFLQTQESPSKMSRTLPNQQGTKTTENRDDSDDEEAPIDLDKMRHLWEEKMTFSPNRVADQSTKQSQPKRMTSYEDKVEEKQVTKGELSEQPSADIPKPLPEVASSDPMPKDLDDYDDCDSFMYEITPHRRIPIRSHWTTESIIEREIKQQTARERELLKEGVIKKRSDQVTVVGDETQVKLQRLESAEKDVGSSESIVNREIRLNKEREDMEAKEQQRIWKVSEGRMASIKTSPSKHVEQTSTHSMQTKPKVTPVKVAEPEISLQDAQVVESLPPRPMQETAPVVPVVLVETEDGKSSQNDQASKDNQPRRKDSIVQREIRMQKEREEANTRERRKALEETKIRRVSLEGSSRSSSGQSTPIKTPLSPTLQRASFTPIKISMSPKAPENAPPAVKTPDKSPVVRFGLSSMQSDPYSSYREYQRVIRGRKMSEKTVERPGPLRATEGNISTTQSPVVFKENNAKEPALQRAPSPLFTRPPSPSPVSPRPPSPQPFTRATVTTEPVLSQDAPDSATKMETALQREIRLAEEREEQLRKQRSASLSRATRKKAVHSDDDINVIIVEKPQVTDRSQVTKRSQVSEESQSGSFSEPDGVWGRGRETPVERDIRLAEERELKLRKERGLSPKPTSNLTTNATAHIETNRPSSPRNVRDQTDSSAYNLKTANYYIKKEFEEERRREVMLKREGKIITVSQCESETTTTQKEETLNPVKRSQDSETLIEREIRLQQEREEQYKKEKGLKSPTRSIVVHGHDGGGSGGATQGGKGDMEDGGSRKEEETAKPVAPKYRPQRRSLNLAQQWEQMFTK